MVRTFSFQRRAPNSLPPTQQHQKLLSAKWTEPDDEEKKVGLNILGLHVFDEGPRRPVSAEALCTLRVATVILAHELETGDPGTGKWAALNALWGHNSHGLSLHLLTALDALAANAHACFLLIPLCRALCMSRCLPHTQQLFAICCPHGACSVSGQSAG